jgi:uncharacterized protein
MNISRFAITVLAAVSVGSIAQAQTIGIGTSPPGSLTHSVGSAVAKLITQDTGIQARVQPHSGNSAYIPAVNAGEVDFGNANQMELTEALSGTGIYKGQKLSNLRVTNVMMVLRSVWFVAKDSSINSMQDLKGKRVPGKWSAQRAIKFNTDAYFSNAGLTYDDVKIVPVPSVSRGADDFIQGKVDAFFFAVGAGKTRQAGAKVGGLKALSLDPSPEAMARFQKKLPGAYALQLKPSKANYGIDKPTYVSAFDMLYITNKNVSNDTVYKVVKAMYGGKKKMFKSFKPLGANFHPKKMAKKLAEFTYHPGAIKFYKEVGLWPPKG